MFAAMAEKAREASSETESGVAQLGGRLAEMVGGVEGLERQQKALSPKGQGDDDLSHTMRRRLVEMGVTVDANPYAPRSGVRTPQWVLEAQVYNQALDVTAQPGFPQQQLHMWSLAADKNACYWAQMELRERGGLVGLAFQYMVASAQQAVNDRYTLRPGERKLTVDGKLGPETARRMADTLGDEQAARYAKEREEERAAEARFEAEWAQESIQDMDNLGQLSTNAGGMLDAMFPRPGDKKSLTFQVNCRPNPAISIGLEFNFRGERTDAGKLKLGLDLGGFIRGDIEVGAFGVSVASAWAKARLYGYMDVSGDSGGEIFDLIQLAIWDKVADVSVDVAQFLWGGGFAVDVSNQMDDDDYIEYGWGFEASGGASWGSSNGAGGNQYKAQAGVKHQQGKRLVSAPARYGSGKMYTTEDTRTTTYSGALTVAAAGAKFTGQLAYSDIRIGGRSKGKVKGTLHRKVSAAQLLADFSSGNLGPLFADWGMSAIGGIIKAVDGTVGLGVSAGGGRTVGTVLATARDLSMAANLAEVAGLAQLGSQISGLSGSIGQKLDVTVSWSDKGCEVSVELARTSGFEIGTKDKTPIYLKFEDATRLLKWKEGF